MKTILAAVAAALLCASPANADTTDDAFIASLNGLGFSISDRLGVLHNAHVVCDWLWSGMSPYEAAHQIDVAHSAVDYAQSKAFVAESVKYYCLPSGV